MERTRMRTLTTLTFFILCGLAASVTADSGQPIDERKPARSDGEVEIINVAGTVTVEGWDREEIHVTGTLGAGSKELKFEVHGDEAEIRVVLPKGSHQVDPSHLTVQLPRGSSVKVETVSADITVSGVEGELDMAAVSGDVKVNGDPKSVDVATVSGDLHMACRSAEIDAATVSGDLLIDVTGLEEGDFETVSGEMTMSGALASGGKYDFASFSGDVELRLPPDSDVRFEVATFSGSIRNDLSERQAAGKMGKEMEFVLGDGSARVTVETFSGDVRLLPAD